MSKGTLLTIWSILMAAFGMELGRWADSYFVTEPFVFWFRMAIGVVFIIVMSLGVGMDFIKERKEEKES